MPQEATREELQQRVKELEELVDRYRNRHGELHAAHRKLRMVFDAIQGHLAIVAMDLDFNVTEINDFLAKTVHLASREAALGRKCYEVLKGRDRVCPDCAVAETYRTGHLSHRMTTSLDEQHTRGRNFEIFAFPLHDDKGQLTGVLEFARDITEQKRLLKEQKRLRRQLQALWDLGHMTEMDHHTLCDTVLSELLAMTQSRYAFYCFLNDEHDVLTGYSLSEASSCSKSIDKKVVEFSLQQAGLWTKAVHTRKTIVCNDWTAGQCADDSWAAEIGLDIKKLMYVPVSAKDRVVALIAVANKKSDYTAEDARQVETFCSNVQTILDRRQTERELQEHFEHLDLEVKRRTAKLEEEIQRRREIENALRTSEEDKTNILQTMSELVVYVDADMKIIWANRAAAESVNIPADELVGRYCYQVWLKQDRPCRSCPAKTILKTGEPADGYTRSPDGRRWHFKGYPIKNRWGKVVRIVEVVEEICDGKEAKETLRSQLQLEQLVASISTEFINSPPERIDAGIDRALEVMGKFFRVDRSYLFLLRENGTIMDNTNEWCAEGIEAQKSHLQGIPVEPFKWWTDNLKKSEHLHIPRVVDLPEEASAVKAALLDQQIQSLIVVPVVTSGSMVGFIGFDSVRKERSWSEENIALLQLVGEIVSNALERRRSETERKSLQEQLYNAQKMEAIGTLAGGIAHDFNNLLMVIQGHTSLMQMDSYLGREHLERLEGIRESVQRGADLTRQLLGFARGGKYEVQATDLNQLVEKSSHMFARTGKEIRIHRKYAPDLRMVEVDRGQIEQVLLNIYVNAWQAMPGGGDLYLETTNVLLERSFTESFGIRAGAFVRLSVTDTGVGMDERTRKRIFEPFFTTREMGRGTGLGLASAYGIVKNHGGIIDVRSRSGKGSTFTIYLPASEAKPQETENRKQHEIMKGNGRILLVDDEEMILDVGEAMLRSMGYDVRRAEAGKEALALYRKHGDEIDLVILDMVMPDMHGGETYDRLKEIDPDVRVLLSSGYSINGQAADILARGCEGFIQKPFEMAELSAKIKTVLNRK